ncbi:hypothetical protein PROFUN_13569 [Planoprotostelium fungivorum]|uniref:Cap-specific mRNA (nucleoside-2'-O-)-methyltransferase 2 n=1 Tax=Planoprotostelium fungivorum TaxID=1890364 RepID=A0A2P6N3I0_9EUKA|nr:hypothetical protein PROFUN_13569 [Planoprotostelium fungivorum]
MLLGIYRQTDHQGIIQGCETIDKEPVSNAWMNPEELDVLKRYISRPGKYIEKEFVFAPLSERPTLPSRERLFASTEYTIEELRDTKQSLAASKSSLDELDMNAWLSHSAFVSLTGFVVRELRNNFSPEMCTIAWTKMYEMLYAYQLCGVGTLKDINTLHVCEAPGGFICAVNHYLRKEHCDDRGVPPQWSWSGVSLNPYYEGNSTGAMIDDDRFIVHTIQHWNFGVDNTGNIMDQDNILKIWQDSKQKGGNTLVTGDGSVDCDWSPNEQESLVANLHYCEAVAALGSVAIGGNVVIKAFTLFEHSSLDLVYLFYCLFRKVIICKPATSKAANSEIYIVGKDFQGISQEYLDTLLSFVSSTGVPGKSLFYREDIPQAFVEQFIRCSKMMSRIQEAVLKRSMSLFHDFRDEKRYITPEKHRIARDFPRRFRIRDLRQEEHIISSLSLDGSRAYSQNHQSDKKNVGSLADRKRAREEMESNFKSGEAKEETPVKVEEEGKRGHSECSLCAAEVKHVSKAQKMMEAMGYTRGEGLGREGQGMKEAITQERRPDRAGIGIRGKTEAEVHIKEGVFSSSARNQNTKEPNTSSWLTVGKRYEKIMNPRFTFDRNLTASLYGLCNDRHLIDIINKPETLSSYSPPHMLANHLNVSMGELEAYHVESMFQLKEENLFNLGRTPFTWEMTKYFLLSKKRNGSGFGSSLDNYQSIEDSGEKGEAFTRGVLAQVKERDWSMVIADGRIGDTKLEPLPDEVSSQETLIEQTLTSLLLLKEGGDLFFKMASSHSRFSVALVWILSQLFGNVFFFRSPLSCPLSTDRILICRTFQQKESQWAESLLRSAQKKLNELKDDNVFNLLEIVPLPQMNQDFFAFMKSANDDLDGAQLSVLQSVKDGKKAPNLLEDEEWLKPIKEKFNKERS